ncbi:glucans biosynthesis glucosyltransferase H [mine drainage metagenome]|uniref:Glucans biosynthesis glucosyltransferase H n=1 Tax=mine drainage metagenome TaxID=410659 RepID=A0A1J5PLH5_9ZZZZ
MASRWIVWTGLIGLAAAYWLAPALVLWLLPVALPMILAPFLISWTSRKSTGVLMRVPSELHIPKVVEAHDHILARWQAVAEVEAREAQSVRAAPAKLAA